MKRKNLTRNALVTSIISLLLCVSMLVGTTFAWFTDEVVSGRNTIAAGNLDVALLADGKEVDSNTILFDDVDPELWEPGAVAYENLQVSNEGTLALKYRLTLDVYAENDLNGHKLSEVVKVAVVDKIADNATRADVLEAAKAAVAADRGLGTLANFSMTGELEAGDKSVEKTVVVFWAPNDNAVDNLYNANNGQKTSDGEPLFIDFAVNLQATQKMSEADSFGSDYDQSASILPKAIVNDLGPKTIQATVGIGGAAKEYEAPFTLQFLPNETLAAAQASEYKDWHADFVVKADRDVKAESIALAGYYHAWCQFNSNYWVSLIADQDVEANTEIRLVSALATVSYEEICNYGNDSSLTAEQSGFQCTAIDLSDGDNAGTTITVELRMYETDETKGALSTLDSETGHYEVIGTYTYTFPNAKAASTDELNAALNAGAQNIDLAAGTYTFPASKLTEGTTLYCEEGTVFEGKTGLNINGATVIGATFTNENDYLVNSTTVNGTFKDCVFTDCDGLRYCYAGDTVVFENCVFDTDFYGVHFDGGANDVVFKNCTFTGFNAFGSAVTKLTMEGCTFKYNGKGGYNGVNLWGESELIDCTFVFDGSATYEWIDNRSATATVTLTNCVVTDGTTTIDIATVAGSSGGGPVVIN